jgi:hypothetical protein
MPSPGHPHRVRRPLSQAAARSELQKPCQWLKLMIISDLALIGGARERAESAIAAAPPGK